MVRLVDGAFAARLSYREALDAVLRGAVLGERRGYGWWVDPDELKRYAAARRNSPDRE
jgi:hypothetical protein